MTRLTKAAVSIGGLCFLLSRRNSVRLVGIYTCVLHNRRNIGLVGVNTVIGVEIIGFAILIMVLVYIHPVDIVGLHSV